MKRTFVFSWSFCTLLFINSLYSTGVLKAGELQDTRVSVSECQYSLCVTAIFQNEAPYLKEWIEYHKLLGVEHFRLYNNESTDNYLVVLAPYIQKGEVTLIDWSNDLNQWDANTDWMLAVQVPAHFDAISYFRGISKWLAIIDLDEFLVPLEHSNLVSFLEEYESEAGVLINWQNFGTSGISEVPDGKLMVEVLTQKAQEKSFYNRDVKSIVRPEKVDLTVKFGAPHIWHYTSSADKWILPDHSRWKLGKVDISKIRINHYVHRTERYFYECKIPRKERIKKGVFSPSYIDQWKSSCNEVEDTEIFRFIPELRAQIFCEI